MSVVAKSLLGLSGFFLLSAIAFVAFYGASGQYVDENGWLVEEFWAFGLGVFSLLLATAFGLIFVFKMVREQRRKRLSDL